MAKVRAARSTRTKAVGYLRCSTDKQEASIPDQRKAVQKYADDNGYEIVRWYIDDGISGDDTERRAGFLSMHHVACNGRDFDCIIVWDQDRFGRFNSMQAGYYIYPLMKAGVKLVTVNEGLINWDDFTGRLMYTIKQEGKHQFLHDLSRNVLRGHIEAAQAGSWVGSIPYGYVLQGPKKNKRLVLGDPRKVKVVKRIFHEFTRKGYSMSLIAARLNADKIDSPGWGKKGRRNRWICDTVKSILENPAYIGTFRSNRSTRCKYHYFSNGQIVPGSKKGLKDESDWIVIPDHHAAIIDNDTFEHAQKILGKGKTGRPPHTADTNPYLFVDLLRCGRCGEKLWGFPGGKGKKFRYYECKRMRQSKGKECHGSTVREDQVLQNLVDDLQCEILGGEVEDRIRHKAKNGTLTAKDVPEAFDTLKRLLTVQEIPRTDPKQLKKQIERLDADIAKMTDNLPLLDPENIPSAQEKIRAYKAQRAELARELNDVPTERDLNSTVLTVLSKLYRLCSMEPEKIKPVLRELDYIMVFTTIDGQKTRRRHKLRRGEIHLRNGGAINAPPKVQPLVRNVTGKLNPHPSG